MTLVLEEILLKGHAISAGIGIGTPYFLDRHQLPTFECAIKVEEVDREILRYQKAIQSLKEEIRNFQIELEATSDRFGPAVLNSQFEILNDPLLTVEIEQAIRFRRMNAESVLKHALEKYEKHFLSLQNSFFMDRFRDIRNLSLRLFDFLDASNQLYLSQIPTASILCVDELTASDAASAKSGLIEAFVTSSGGSTTHAAIIAKSKGIPLITNVSLKVIRESLCDIMIIDGYSGIIILNPTEETLEKYGALKHSSSDLLMKNNQKGNDKTQTFDGYMVRLYANIDTLEEIDQVKKFGASGVGLFRSEYLFHSQNRPPSEDEQALAYSKMAEKIGHGSVVIRTFDFEGDKKLFIKSSSIKWDKEEREKLLKTQLRAVLRANFSGRLRLLFPMIATIEELKERKAWLLEAQKELQIFHPLLIGCMIEIPSAALTLEAIAKECDFFSIGTNDLVHYTLGANRCCHQIKGHEVIDSSLIRLIKWITKEASKRKIPVCLCGEIAANPLFVPLLIGLGVQELSVSPRFLPIVKETIRRTSIVEAVELADKALLAQSLEEIEHFLRPNGDFKRM